MTVRNALEDLAGQQPTVEMDAVVEEDGYEVEEDATTYEPEPAEAAPGSILGTLRARAQQLQQEKTIDIAIPGYRDQLWGRYHAVSLSRVYNQSGEINPIIPRWQIAADILAQALDALYYRNEHGELQALYPEPIRFDDELVDMFGLKPGQRTARAVLVALCGGGAKGESLVWTHFMSYQGWLMNGEETTLAQEVADSAVGEYPAT